MTPEELCAEADKALSPAIERRVHVAFNTLPAERVEDFIVWYMDLMKQVAAVAVHDILEEERRRLS